MHKIFIPVIFCYHHSGYLRMYVDIVPYIGYNLHVHIRMCMYINRFIVNLSAYRIIL